MTPEHEHDCTHCAFLGQVSTPYNSKVDVWYHPSNSKFCDTVIARYSSDGPDYGSMVLPEGLYKQYEPNTETGIYLANKMLREHIANPRPEYFNVHGEVIDFEFGEIPE